MTVDVKIDMRNFNRGFQLAQEFSKRAPAESCNFAGKEVAYGAYKNTPFVVAQKIDAELDVIVAPVIGKRGKVLKNKKKYVPAKTAGVPFAALLVQARANPSSKYNLLTNSRYALAASPFKGVSREAGRAAMSAMIDLMVKSRKRTPRFIASGWLNAIAILKSLVSSKYGNKSVPPPSNDALGTAIPAKRGQLNAFCLIENDVGLDGKNAASHNRALQLYGAPALQSALDHEGKVGMDYFLRKTGKEDLETPVNKAWS